MISKELLSEVLGIKIPDINRTNGSWLCVSKVGSFTEGREYTPIFGGRHNGHIIDDTGDTEWRHPAFYKDKNGNPAFINYEFLVGNVYELAHKCKEWAWELDYRLHSGFMGGKTGICQLGKHQTTLSKSFQTDNEPNAVFQACQWILDNKDK